MTTQDPVQQPEQRSAFTAPVIALLALAGVLLAGNIYFILKTNSLEHDVAGLRTMLKSEVNNMQSSVKTANAERDKAISDVQRLLETAEAKMQQAAIRANVTSRSYAEQLAKKMAAQQNEQIKSTSQQLQQSSQTAHQQLVAEIGEMRQAANQTTAQVSGIASEVTNVKTVVASTKSELDRILADMRTVRGDLGVQSGLIATNSRELAALRSLGERDYVEFSLLKTKNPQRIGDVAVKLKKLDTRKNRFTIELIANDKKMEKKDRTINEPVQFYTAKTRLPHEIVVNEVQRDKIVGYISMPKLKEARN
jgi:uncharacterized phage infection (PIP) family protein YhgE